MTGEDVGLMLALGAACACVFDLFRALHMLMTRHTAAVIISDVLYWIVVTAGIIYSLWRINDITVRLYEAAALIMGAALYFMLIGTYIYRFFSAFVAKIAVILQYFFKLLRYILKILLTPAQFLYKISIVSLCDVVGRRIKNRAEKKVR